MPNPTRQAPNATCVECGVDFRVPPCRAAAARFCSWACRSARPRNNRPNERVQWSCENCGEQQLRQQSEASTRFCSRACSVEHLNRTGNPRRTGRWIPCAECEKAVYVTPCLEGRKRYCSKDCANANKDMPARFKVSRISQEIADLFEQRNPSIRTERELRLHRWSVDIALVDLRIAIEIDGVYWHSLPGIAEKDARKDHYLSSQGWKVLRFPVEREAAIDVVLLVEERLAAVLADERQAFHEWNPTRPLVPHRVA